MPDRLPEVANAILVEMCRVGVPAFFCLFFFFFKADLVEIF